MSSYESGYNDGYQDGYEDGMEDGKQIGANEERLNSKYRWHDLRKNPEDLPKGNWVMCFCAGNQYQVMRMDLGGDWLTWYPSIATFIHNFVIAWREIEPFEEG